MKRNTANTWNSILMETVIRRTGTNPLENAKIGLGCLGSKFEYLRNVLLEI